MSPVCPALGYTVSSFSNGFPGCPGEGLRFSVPRRPSTSSLQHPSFGEESTHALIAPDEQVSKCLPGVFLWVWVGVGHREIWHLLPVRITRGKKVDRVPSCPEKGRQLPWKARRTRKRRRLQLLLPVLLFSHPVPCSLLPLCPRTLLLLDSFPPVPHLRQHASQ